jgi:hypothetical protein
MITATWTTVPIKACHLAVGDRVNLANCTLDLVKARDCGDYVDLVGEVRGGHVFRALGRHELVTVHVPDVPVDGYNLWKPTTSPLGCTCLSRRGADRNWHIVATDPNCRWCGNHDDWD